MGAIFYSRDFFFEKIGEESRIYTDSNPEEIIKTFWVYVYNGIEYPRRFNSRLYKGVI